MGLIPPHMPHQLVAGVGFRTSASSADIVTLVDRLLAQAGRPSADLAVLATLRRKADAPNLLEAARMLDCTIAGLTEAELAQAKAPSDPAVLSAIGIGSVAEAAARCFGPLLIARQVTARVTCALSHRILR